MKIFLHSIFVVLSLVFLIYLALPTPSFPDARPVNSPQSDERGDTEDFKNRRAYFTDYLRDQVIAFHIENFKNTVWGGNIIPLPTYRLNYPPEDAMIYIKDLTRSWYLEEIIHPFRESFFVNGFVPQEEKDTIIINGRHFEEKITVRYYRSDILARLGVGIGSMILLYLLTREWYRTFFVKQYD